MPNLPTDACPVPWCEETGQHDEHRAYLGSWVVDSLESAYPSTVQVFVTSALATSPSAVLAVVDGHLRQSAVRLSWSQAGAVAGALVDARRRFGA